MPRLVHPINEALFDKHTPESCYWAGFIAADGGIVGNALSFNLSPHDRVMLESFKACAGFGHKISLYKGKNGQSDRVSLQVKNQRWIAALLEKFGIGEKKTFVLKPPSLTGALAMHFIRGFFDGDGHFDPAQRRVEIGSAFLPMLEWIQATWGVESSIYPTNKKPPFWRLSAGSPVIIELFQAMYRDAPVGLRLERKYQAFLQGVEQQKGTYRGGRKKVSDEELVSLAEQGKSFRHIARLAGVSHCTVRTRLKRMGYERPLGYRSPEMRKGQAAARGRAPSVPLETLVEKLKEGKSLSQIGREVGLTVQSVRGRFIRKGVSY